MDTKRLVESIVREVMQSMKAETPKQQKVLYIFSDSTEHEAYTNHFIVLNNSGVAHDLLFLDGETSGWLGKHRIESGGPGKVIAVDEFAPAPLEIPQNYEGVIIPEIDLDNAGRAALGMRGTVMSEIIFAAIVQGKFVLLGDDSPGLKRADRRTLKRTSLPKPYMKLFDHYKQELMTYGVQFAPRERLAEIAASHFRTAPSEREPEAALAPESATAVFPGRLVTEEWVRRNTAEIAGVKRVEIRKGALVSPLAKDLLKEKGIAVEIAD